MISKYSLSFLVLILYRFLSATDSAIFWNRSFITANVVLLVSTRFIAVGHNSPLNKQTYVVEPQIHINQTSMMNIKASDYYDSDQYDITLISQTSVVRLFYIPYVQNQWKGPVVITIYMTEEDMTLYNTYLEITSIYPQLLLVPYIVKDASIEYPINKLRNMSIRRVKTSHFWIADMDMWPTKRTYSALVNLPKYILADPYLAIIVPAFSFAKESTFLDCPSHKECVDLVMPNLPKTKEQLYQCMQERKCHRFRPESETHDYVSDNWFTLRPNQQITFLRCINILQEPYVVVKKSEHMPYFDERFFNYGYNKIQYIDHLKYIGYKFALLSQEFAFDIPHPSSKFALQWSQQWKTNHVEMKVVYDQFLLELTQKYEQRTVITTCDKKSTLKTVLVHEKIPSTAKLNVRSNVQNEKQKQLERASRRKRNIRYLKKVQPSVSNLYKTT